MNTFLDICRNARNETADLDYTEQPITRAEHMFIIINDWLNYMVYAEDMYQSYLWWKDNMDDDLPF